MSKNIPISNPIPVLINPAKINVVEVNKYAHYKDLLSLNGQITNILASDFVVALNGTDPTGLVAQLTALQTLIKAIIM